MSATDDAAPDGSAAPDGPVSHDGLSAEPAPRSRWVALVVLCAGMLMIVLDATVVNVALPVIKAELGFSQASLAWVFNAYMIAFGGLLLLAGRLGDLVSRRGMFLAGQAVFAAASLACGLAGSPEMLVVARFVQGIGGAMTAAVILGMIVTLFPEGREQAKAIGVYSFAAVSGGAIGLLAGGVLTHVLNWHWIFFINVPIGIAAILLTLRFVDPDTGIGLRGGTDVSGAVLITSALMLGVYTIVEPASRYGWADIVTLLLGGLALVLLALFVAREATARTPLIPLRIFRSRIVVGANVVQALAVSGMFAMFFLGVLYLQQVLGYNPLQAGLAFLPSSAVMGVLSLRYVEKLIMRFGARALALPGLGALGCGLALFARVPVDGRYVVDVLPGVLLVGVGVGTLFPALASLAMSGATKEDAGLASGLINTTNRIGSSLGLAVLATLSATRTEELAATGAARDAALTGGFRAGFLLAVGIVVVAMVVVLVVLRPFRR
ncbi:DHA2 family efflux MFS transporter permease subunit [Haloechinothrix halophila]|uniref:DHA2 family efflux MFS transporter permease subunit n=1 Tax=Haloechinothrix halophila TaxID=1069073 RepID=UPI000413EBF7|nr:DHA2 family efflux MFS transporter permease subunit [Haloechinothrix halophila]